MAKAALEYLRVHGIVGELHLLTGVSHEQVPLWLNASDCLILTSEHEGSPNIVKEALACNRPIVSVDVGDVAERIGCIRGCYLSEGRPEALGKCLQKVFESSRQVEGRVHMEELTLQKVARKLRVFYGEVLARWQAERKA
jgi:glycosyltransferase involved in cell wall biosynthesis